MSKRVLDFKLEHKPYDVCLCIHVKMPLQDIYIDDYMYLFKVDEDSYIKIVKLVDKKLKYSHSIICKIPKRYIVDIKGNIIEYSDLCKNNQHIYIITDIIKRQEHIAFCLKRIQDNMKSD